MKTSFQKLLESVLPFIILGVTIAFLIAMLVVFSYIVLWGIIIGGILGLFAWVKNRFFVTNKPKETQKGRIIEHDDSE